MYLSYLWTDRMKWIKNYKKKSKGCVFCKIVNKKEKAFVLKEGDVYVIMNKFPYNTGHLLIFPKRHVKDFDELSKDELEKLFITAQKAIKLLKKVLKPKGFNIGINIGEVASASIEHIHIHIVPRFGADAGFMEIFDSTKVMPEPLEKTYEKLKKFSYLLE
jgi:ATP adenylyltransferase